MTSTATDGIDRLRIGKLHREQKYVRLKCKRVSKGISENGSSRETNTEGTEGSLSLPSPFLLPSNFRRFCPGVGKKDIEV